MNSIGYKYFTTSGQTLAILRRLGLLVLLAMAGVTSANAQARFSIRASNVLVNDAANPATVTAGRALVAFDYDARLLHYAASQKSQLWVAVGPNGSDHLQLVTAGGTTLRGSFAAMLPVAAGSGRFQVVLHLLALSDQAAARSRITSGQITYNQKVLDVAIAQQAQTAMTQPATPPATPPPAAPVTLPATAYTAPTNVNPPAAVDPTKLIMKNSSITLTGQDGQALGAAQSHFDGYYLLAGSAAEHQLGGSDSKLKSGDVVTIKNTEADNWSGKWQAYKFIAVGSTPTLYYYPASGASTQWRIWKGAINGSPGKEIQTGDAVTIESMSYLGEWIKPHSGGNFTTDAGDGYTFTIRKTD
jgi:hypothetical protein